MIRPLYEGHILEDRVRELSPAIFLAAMEAEAVARVIVDAATLRATVGMLEAPPVLGAALLAFDRLSHVGPAAGERLRRSLALSGAAIPQ